MKSATIVDGNHRFAAAIYKKEQKILAAVYDVSRSMNNEN